MQKINQTLEASNEAAKKMNELADNVILARNRIVGGLAVYASYMILRKYVIKPFIKTFKFLSNQTKNMGNSLTQKYGQGLVVVACSTSNLGKVYT